MLLSWASFLTFGFHKKGPSTVLIWRLLCVLHVWLLRKCKKRNKNIYFYNFLGNELFEEEHKQFWRSEEEHEQLWKEHKEHDKGMIFQRNNKKKN